MGDMDEKKSKNLHGSSRTINSPSEDTEGGSNRAKEFLDHQHVAVVVVFVVVVE